MKQFLMYGAAVVLFASVVIAYRYIQQQQQTDEHVVQSAEEGSKVPSVPDVERVLVQPGAAESASDDIAGQADGSPATGNEAAANAPVDEPPPSLQTGSVQYTAPPNPGAASLGEFEQHFQKQLNRMPPEERDAAELSRRMQRDYKDSRSSLADAVNKSKSGQ
ncbi:hypothetical protein DFR30_2598 [Thiogranum longum]|uniref:Uncharacterized protein n=1 Tax=Thiogranum longum TaxID=1537524 RepID=A0A4R1HCV2_9GAMM|nr:hypothetical protein [Thiogranum longum]TCK19288.1 hypothetical protein DFR30_2598 [Thiogranum longum]